MKNKYFHLTDCENTAKIMQEGIKANKSGDIYVFTDMLVANPIAKEQVFAERYSVFEIDRKGICGIILNDDAGELTQGYHRIIKQKLIKPKFLKLICEKDTIYFEPTEWDYIRGQYLGRTRNEVDQQFSETKKNAESYRATYLSDLKAKLKDEKILEEMRARAQQYNLDPDKFEQMLREQVDMPKK